jgi:GNAT superfamily N-acetyltransferase
MYRIREVDGHDDEIADTLADLHRLTFFESAPTPEFDWGYWWLAYHEHVPVAFGGLVPSTHASNAGYFCRVGVMDRHRGRALQLRLMRATECRARRKGWCCIISDTTDNVVSANNFIRVGYRLYQPEYPWGSPNTLYWQKSLGS